MDIAQCTDDGIFYNAVDFSQLHPDELARKRRFLQCPECGGPAFFRHASPIGRSPCFGARPHAEGCTLTAYDYHRALYGADEDQDALLMPGGKIVVDFGYGSPARHEHFYGSVREPMQERSRLDHDLPHAHIYHRRLGSLLRTLIKSPAFSRSYLIVEVEGRVIISARDLFVPLQCATYQYSGIFKGYFGVISHAKFAPDNSLWLNSGGNDNISFCIDALFADVIMKRYGINDLEAIAGAYILVFGTPRVSQNGKLFCLIAGPEQMAISLT